MTRLFLRLLTPAVAMLIIAVSTLPGQDSTGRHVSLEDAIRLAMEQNPELTSARLEVERSDARVTEAIGNALPALSLSGRYTHALEKPVFFLPDFSNLSSGKTIPVKIGSDFSMDATVAAQQILFNGAVFVGVGAAHIYSHMARDLYSSKQVETVAKVRKSFYGALLAGEVTKMMRSSLANAEDNLKNVQLLRAQGVLSEYDELRASVGVENLRPMVLQSETNAGLALDGLRNVIGLNSGEPIVLDGALAFMSVDDSVVARAEETMMEANPNLSAMRKQVELNGAIIFAERSNYLPTIAAFGQYQFQAAKNDFNFSTRDFIRSSQVGLSISLSLFQGFQTYARVEQAQLERRKTEEQQTSLERSLRTGLNSIKGSLQQARKRVQAQEKTVETAERGYRIVTARFLSNAATQLEVNDAQLALTQARVNRVQAVYDYLVAATDLDQLLGRIPAYAMTTNE